MKVSDLRAHLERRMREVTVYGLVPDDAPPILAADPVQAAHLRIDVLEEVVLDLLDRIERGIDDRK